MNSRKRPRQQFLWALEERGRSGSCPRDGAARWAPARAQPVGQEPGPGAARLLTQACLRAPPLSRGDGSETRGASATRTTTRTTRGVRAVGRGPEVGILTRRASALLLKYSLRSAFHAA